MRFRESNISRKSVPSRNMGRLFGACGVAILVLLMLCLSDATFAQGRGGPPGGGDHGGGDRGGGPPSSRGGPPSSGGGSGSDRMTEMLRSADTNHDGQIEISEVPEYRRGMVQGMLQRMGMDTSRPVPIDQIRQRMSGGGPPQPQSGGPPPSPRSSGPTPTQPATDPLVPGFGIAQETATVHPFGARAEEASVSSYYGSGSSESDDRTTRYAREAIQRYDRNRNGVIDRDETEGMRSDPREIDRNHDGRITMEEMVHRVQQYQGGRDRGDDGDRDDNNEEERYSGVRYRTFRTIDAFIPEGTPEWFIRLDKNRDANIPMAEYSTEWTDKLALDFEWWDVNKDGIITPQECIEATKENEEDERGFSHPDPPPLEGEEAGGEEPPQEGEQPQGEQPQGEQPQGEQPQPEQPQGEQPPVVVQQGEGTGAMTVQIHAAPSGERPPGPSRYEGSREGPPRGDGGGDYGRGRGDGGGGRR